jgi:hypothetical protein
LDAHIAFNKVHEPSHIFDSVIKDPLVFINSVVPLLFEEKDFGAASHHQGLFEYQFHLAKLHVRDFLKANILDVFHRNAQDLPLSVEDVHLIVF